MSEAVAGPMPLRALRILMALRTVSLSKSYLANADMVVERTSSLLLDATSAASLGR